MAEKSLCPAHQGKIQTVYTKKGPIVRGGNEEQRKKHQERVDNNYEKFLKESDPDEYAAFMKRKDKKAKTGQRDFLCNLGKGGVVMSIKKITNALHMIELVLLKLKKVQSLKVALKK